MVVKVDDCRGLGQKDWYDDIWEVTVDSKPLVDIFTLWKLDGSSETPTSKRGLGELSQLVTASSPCCISWPELATMSARVAILKGLSAICSR